jgi:riboflavin synthase
MFTGIIEDTGRIEKIERKGDNIDFTLSCSFTEELKIDQSLAHNGCCLTIIKIVDNKYTVTAINETLEKTNLRNWQIGALINLERCTKLGERLDGHIVQGHIDITGTVENIENKNGSFYISIVYDETTSFITVPQGSITVNGISLTVAESNIGRFSVAIIPYTWEITNMNNLKIGDIVNIEFDIIGKYIAKLLV